MILASLLQEVEPAGGVANRTILLALMVILPLGGTLIVVFGGLRLKSMLRRMPKIANRGHLEAYRAEHRLHGMLGVLIKALLAVANVLFVVDLFVLGGPITDLFYSVLPSLANIAVPLPFRAAEQQVNEIPCATEELRKEWLEILQGERPVRSVGSGG